MAPAKINLFLHVLDKRADGYHELDSLIAFADIGDRLEIAPHAGGQGVDALAFDVTGPYASAFGAQELDATPHSSNLVVRAAWGLAALAGRRPDVRITLEKNLPLSSGIGGGSADAAACIRGLLQYWSIAPSRLSGLDDLLLALGADVPVCFLSASAQMRGIGEQIMPYDAFPALPALLVNPAKPCPTGAIFKMLGTAQSPTLTLPPCFDSADAFYDFLRRQNNDLQQAAQKVVPEIGDVLKALGMADGCRLARLSGSGATCFGLFASAAAAQQAQSLIRAHHPDWWVQSCQLNRPERHTA